MMNSTTNSSLDQSNYTLALETISDYWLGINSLVSLACGALYIAWALALLAQRHINRQLAVFLGNLIAIDFLSSSIFYEINAVITYSNLRGYPVYRINCQALYYVWLSIQPTGNWISLLMAVNRYLAVCRPHSYQQWCTTKVTLVSLVCVWLLNPLLDIPLLLSLSTTGATNPAVCGGSAVWFHYPKAYQIRATVVGYYIPIFAIGVLYAAIYVNVGVKGQTTFGTSTSAKARMRKRLSVTKILFATFAWYVACYIPPILWNQTAPAHLQLDERYTLWIRTVVLCGFLGNPLIFFVMSAEYRTAIKRVCCSRIAALHTIRTIRPSGSSSCRSKDGVNTTNPV